ncbi:MAG: hypothetical protein ACI4UN_04070, partial [Muribaculaceae bacterium]
MCKIRIRLLLILQVFIVSAITAFADDNVRDSRKNMFEDYYVTQMRDSTLAMEKRLDAARNLIDNQKNPRLGLLLEYVDMCQSWGSYRESSRVLGVVKERLEVEPADDGVKLAYRVLLARNFYRLGNYDESANESFNIISLKKPDSLRCFDTFARLELANTYLRVGYEKSVESYISEIEADLESVKFPDERAERYVRWQLSKVKLSHNLRRKQIDSAFVNFNENLKWEYSEQTRNCDAIYRAELYDYLGEYKISNDIYRELLAMPRLSPEHRMVVINNYSWAMLDDNRAGEALRLLKENAADIEQIENSHLRCFLYNSLARAYAETGQYKMAYERSRKAQALVDSFFSDNVNQRLITLSRHYDADTMLARERAVQRRTLIVTVALATASLLLILLIATMWRLARRNRRLKTEMAQLTARLDNYDESRRLEINSTNEIIDTKNRELASMAMHNANVGKLLDDIVSAIDDHSKSADDRLEHIRREIRRINMQHSMWEMFNTFFSQVYKNFFSSLSERYPSLTKGELRMCAFMVLNLTSKEIAMITNRSARTVDTIKYSLRKKMGIDESTPTVAHLRS